MRNCIKICLIIIILNAFYGASKAQTFAHLQVQGKVLKGIYNDTIIMKGVNYAVYNYGYTVNENYFAEIKKTNANTVRLVWYKNSSLPAYNPNLILLDSALARCKRNKMIPIIELHDATCVSDITTINSLLSFYTSATFKTLELKYRDCLIINIANEAGYYNWTANPTAALVQFKDTYSNAIQTLRAASLQVPIMIDAPDCGSNSDAFTSGVAQQIFNADALGNTIFSTHAYWASFANNDSATMATKIQALVNTGLCVFFGEISNQQDGNVNCEFNLNYKALLRILKQQKIGWLAWVWVGDVCPNRQLSLNGNFNNLSVFGNFITNDSEVGLLQNTILPVQFNLIVLSLNPNNSIFNRIGSNFKIHPNPVTDFLQIKKPTNIYNYSIEIFSLPLMQKILVQYNSPNFVNCNNFRNGMYTIKITNSVNGRFEHFVFTKK